MSNGNGFREGLRKLPPDKRDFSLGKVLAYPALSELPANFELQPFKIKNQLQSDYCTAFASTSASELQEDIELSPEFAFAMGKKLSGNVFQWGQDLRTAMKAHVKIGCIEQKETSYSLLNKQDEFLRNPSNWPEDLDDEALKHAKNSFIDCKGPYDAFDNIRSAIWMFRNEKRGVAIGLLWGWLINEPIIEKPNGGFGHGILAIGWKTINGQPYIAIQNSYGEEAGDKGKYYLSRDVINTYIPQYGAFMFIDMTSKEYLERLKGLSQNWILQALKFILLKLGLLSKYLPPKVEPFFSVDQPPPPPAPIPGDIKKSLLEPFCRAIMEYEVWK